MSDNQPAQAQDHHPRWGFTASGGGAQSLLNPNEQPWALGYDMQAGLDYRLNSRWRLFAAVGYRRFFDDTTTTDTFKLPDPGSKSSRAWNNVVFNFGARLMFFSDTRLRPYAAAGLGITSWHIDSLPSGTVIRVPDVDGMMKNFLADEFHANLGAGIEYDLSGRISACAGLDFFYLTGWGASFAKSVDDFRSRGNVVFSLGVTTWVGRIKSVQMPPTEMMTMEPPTVSAPPAPKPEPTKQDADGDGVPDSTDACPDTPPGAPVDSSGCLRDRDDDGVRDPDDRCGATPRGAYVDSTGCPLDSDGDGVYDGLDFCPGTPPEWRTDVDEQGCVGDTDSDGVPDFLDRCPDTERGAPVDSAGCVTDEDRDGVPDSRDLCPGSPTGLAVDTNGCLVMTRLDRTVLLFPEFEAGVVKLDQLSSKILDDLAVRLTPATDVLVFIRAYTDNIGEYENNRLISQRRADLARQYLIDHGAAPDRITAIGLGEVDPIADNETAIGRKRNRRLEITFQRR